MKTFDLKTVKLEKMSVDEQNEVLEYILSLDPIEIYEYIFLLLNKFAFSDDPEDKAYENFLGNVKFKPYRASIMRIVDGLQNTEENFSSKKDYVASNIAYLKDVLTDCRDINDPIGYENEIEELKKFETEYKTL